MVLRVCVHVFVVGIMQTRMHTWTLQHILFQYILDQFPSIWMKISLSFYGMSIVIPLGRVVLRSFEKEACLHETRLKMGCPKVSM
jgi:hypothetical protein